METRRKSFGAIAAANPIIGVVNFIVLNLPLGWGLAALDYPPTIDRILRVKNVRWVAEGEAKSRMVAPKAAAYISITVREGKRIKVLKHQFTINGHEAFYSTGKIKKGLIKKRIFDNIKISFYCDVTNRTISIDITGLNLLKFEKELIDALRTSICH